jgi:hypothetical protein
MDYNFVLTKHEKALKNAKNRQNAHLHNLGAKFGQMHQVLAG